MIGRTWSCQIFWILPELLELPTIGNSSGTHKGESTEWIEFEMRPKVRLIEVELQVNCCFWRTTWWILCKSCWRVIIRPMAASFTACKVNKSICMSCASLGPGIRRSWFRLMMRLRVSNLRLASDWFSGSVMLLAGPRRFEFFGGDSNRARFFEPPKTWVLFSLTRSLVLDEWFTWARSLGTLVVDVRLELVVEDKIWANSCLNLMISCRWSSAIALRRSFSWIQSSKTLFLSVEMLWQGWSVSFEVSEMLWVGDDDDVVTAKCCRPATISEPHCLAVSLGSRSWVSALLSAAFSPGAGVLAGLPLSRSRNPFCFLVWGVCFGIKVLSERKTHLQCPKPSCKI